MMSKNEKIKLSLDIQNYFVSFFETHFSILTQDIIISDHLLTFILVVDNKVEKFIVSYTDLFASKSELNIKSTVDILLLEKIFNKLSNDEMIDYKKRLSYINNELHLVNTQFKFFSHINLENSLLYRFKTDRDQVDDDIYHTLLNNNLLFKLTVNKNLYSISLRQYHFLTGRYVLEFNTKIQSVCCKYTLTTTSLGHSGEYYVPISVAFEKFEAKLKKCKRKMVALIKNECFNDIVANHNISLNQLKKMSELAIKPYADLVYMARI